jgi:hypothetical protein
VERGQRQTEQICVTICGGVACCWTVLLESIRISSEDSIALFYYSNQIMKRLLKEHYLNASVLYTVLFCPHRQTCMCVQHNIQLVVPDDLDLPMVINELATSYLI